MKYGEGSGEIGYLCAFLGGRSWLRPCADLPASILELWRKDQRQWLNKDILIILHAKNERNHGSYRLGSDFDHGLHRYESCANQTSR